MIHKLLELTPFVIWLLSWAIGGWLLAGSALRLPRRFIFGVGLALGAVAQTWTANLLAFFLPAPVAFFGGGAVVFLLGLAFSWPFRLDKFRRALIPESWTQVAVFLALVYVFTAIGLGLGLFDEYQNLPTISLLARGDIPPLFALDPSLRFGYHYFMLLFAAQVMRLGAILPWNALDFTRGLFFGLLMLLTYLWVGRMTRSRTAAYAGALFAAFASGTRWLLLLLPPGWVANLSQNITLLGSAAQSVSDLPHGLTLPWNVDGGPPIPFPFAYINGIVLPHVLDHGGAAMMVAMLVMLLLIVYRFWRDWRGGVVMTILLAALANLSEHIYIVMAFGFGLSLVIHWIRSRSFKIPRDFLPWIAAFGISGIFAALQGGVLTELVRGLLGLSAGAAEGGSYFTVGFALNPHPTVISGHLGLLDLTDPRQLVLALLEVGPLLIAIPITAMWGWKMLKARRWWEAALVFGAVTGIGSLFLRYEGSAGVTATSRLFGDFLIPLEIYFVPLFWVWARTRAPRLKQILLSVGAVTIFGRYTDSNVTWYVPKDSWIALARNPYPRDLRAAGFDYFYYSLENWENFPPGVQKALKDACVKQVVEVTGIRSDTDFRKSWRRLVDIRACE